MPFFRETKEKTIFIQPYKIKQLNNNILLIQHVLIKKCFKNNKNYVKRNSCGAAIKTCHLDKYLNETKKMTIIITVKVLKVCEKNQKL